MSSLLAQSIAYGIVRGAPQIARICLLLIVGRDMPPMLLAQLVTLYFALDLLRVCTDFGLDTYLIRQAARYPQTADALEARCRRWKLVNFCVFLGPIYWIFADALTDLSPALVAGFALATLFMTLTNVVVARAQAAGTSVWLLSPFVVTYAAIFAGLLLLDRWQVAVPILFLWLAAAEACLAIVMLTRSRLTARVSAPPPEFAPMLVTILPLATMLVLGVLYQRLDFATVSQLLSSAEVAAYGYVQRVLDPVLFVCAAICVTLLARFSRQTGPQPGLRAFLPGLAAIMALALAGSAAVYGGLGLVMADPTIVAQTALFAILSVAVAVKAGCLYLTAMLMSRLAFRTLLALSVAILGLQFMLLMLLVSEFRSLGAAYSQLTSDTVNLVIQLGLVMWYLHSTARTERAAVQGGGPSG